jgi:hypothetical protein
LAKLYNPVATHVFAAGHDIPISSALWLPDGAGGRVAVHDAPFHDSASDPKLPPVSDTPANPTATHLFAAAHDTAFRAPILAPAGSFGSLAAHLTPFHVSASGRLVVTSSPTATQLLAEVHVTANGICFGLAKAAMAAGDATWVVTAADDMATGAPSTTASATSPGTANLRIRFSPRS